MKNLRDKPLHVRVVRGFLLAIFLALLAFITPTPYHVQAPGQPHVVGDMISIQTKTFPSRGEFLLPTVVSEPATVLFCLYSFLDPEAVLTNEADSTPHAQTSSSDGGQMAMSQYFSSVVALRELGYDIRGQFRGVRILGVNPDSPNRGILRPGDLLVSLKDKRLTSFKQFKRTITQTLPGQGFQAKVMRDGKAMRLDLDVYQPAGRSLIGVTLRTEYANPDLPFEISFKSGNTLGASGGLVFALQIYDLLTPKDLTKGRLIAATGTLDGEGNVGPIDGINFKLKGAQRAGANIILVPRDNLKNVVWNPKDVKVIPVDSFNDALHALQE